VATTTAFSSASAPDPAAAITRRHYHGFHEHFLNPHHKALRKRRETASVRCVMGNLNDANRKSTVIILIDCTP
jgi:hypothetical protein